MGEGTREEIPLGRRHIIERPRLTRLLDECDARVILLVAPPGYGKTTLAREWRATRGGATAWYDATTASRDVAALATGISSTLATASPDIGRSMTERLRASRDASEEVELLADLLSRDLVEWSSEACLVVDDYHHLAGTRGEEFIDRLARQLPLKVLITSRTRPSWATARRLLYGELFELGRTALAMDPTEVRAVLSTRPAGALPGASLAEGWPAVIGLAALIREIDVPDEQLPAELYDFFAEEVYRALSERSQTGIATLAIAPVVTFDSAAALLGDDAAGVLNEAVRVGFLTRRGEAFDLHPLLRSFITRKAASSAPSIGHHQIARLVAFHMERLEWDEAFAVATNAHDLDLAADVIQSSFSSLVNEGRVQTLQAWVARVPHALSPAVLELTKAEIAFRHGEHESALVLASQAAARLPQEHALAARAHLSAGRAAHFGDKTKEARTLSERAIALAQNAEDRADALWLRFTAAVELEDPSIVSFLEEFEEAESQDSSGVVRAACGRLVIDLRFGLEPNATERAEPIRPLVRHARDPLLRTSFFNLLGRCHTLRANYSAALDALSEAEREASSTRLEFAQPHLLLARAQAEIGRNHLGRARQLLDRVRPVADDPHTFGNERLIRGKVFLVEQRFVEARQAFLEGRRDLSDRATRSELYAYEALASACIGESEFATELAARSSRFSKTVEPTVIAAIARAVAGGLDSPIAAQEIENAVALVRRSRHVDLLALVVRSYPILCAPLTAAGLAIPGADDHSTSSGSARRSELDALSRRETEVLSLVADGLTNREIAKRLFISEVTVKVHVRHIFEKLHVRTRTEAALIAVERRN